MKIISLRCPQCGADLNVESSRQFIFCEYCGQKIYIDDEVQRSEHGIHDNKCCVKNNRV